jgi:O-antigen ligase
VITAALLHCDSINEIIRYLKYILSAYLIISILSILFVPGAMDTIPGAWRGLTPQKNHLGQVSLINLIFWLHLAFSKNTTEKLYSIAMVGLSLVLLLGSKSTTSLITMFLLFSIWIVLAADRKIRTLKVGRVLLLLAVAFFFSSAMITFALGKEVLMELPGFFNKDITFTGRTDLWYEILQEVKNHPLIGAGFEGYWIVENENLLALYNKFVWLPRQAHMGYLDLLNETGLIGIGLFFCMVISYIKNILRDNKTFFWTYIFFATLILNVQESTLFRQNVMTGVMFTFSYLVLHVEKRRQYLHGVIDSDMV